MDKQTLSNYGWVIIAVLCLSVMLALATPFGTYVKEGAKSTLFSLIETTDKAMDYKNFFGEGWEYDILKDYYGGLFEPNSKAFVQLETEDGIVNANWYNLVKYDYLKYNNKVLENGSKVAEMYGELVISKEVSSIMNSSWGSSSVFLKDSNISKITLLDGITEIGAWAFSEMPELTSISLPASVEIIGGGFARNAPKLTTITIDEKNPHFAVIDGVLYTKDKTELVKYPNARPNTEYYILDECENIRPQSCFGLQYLENVYLNNNLQSIGAQAFEHAKSIKNAYINDNAKINNGAFRNAQNVIFHINNTNTKYKIIDNVIYSYNGEEMVCSGFQEDKSITILDTVTYIHLIGNNVTEIIIPNSVKTIRDSAFLGINNYAKLTIRYLGTKEQFENINIGTKTGSPSNSYVLSKAKIIFEE